MKLKATVYETIEYAQDHEYSLTVGNISMEGDELCYAEILDTTIFNMVDVEAIRAFLDEVENVITSDTVSCTLGEDTSYVVKMKIRCE